MNPITELCCAEKFRLDEVTALGRTLRLSPLDRNGRFRRNLAVRARSGEGQESIHLGSSPLSREGPFWDQKELFLERGTSNAPSPPPPLSSSRRPKRRERAHTCVVFIVTRGPIAAPVPTPEGRTWLKGHALPAPADWRARQSIGATGLSIPSDVRSGPRTYRAGLDAVIASGIKLREMLIRNGSPS